MKTYKLISGFLIFATIMFINLSFVACNKKSEPIMLYTPFSVNVTLKSNSTYYLRYISVYYFGQEQDFENENKEQLLFRIEDRFSNPTNKISPNFTTIFLRGHATGSEKTFNGYNLDDISNKIYFRMYVVIENTAGIAYRHWGNKMFSFNIEKKQNEIITSDTKEGVFSLKTDIYGYEIEVRFDLEKQFFGRT